MRDILVTFLFVFGAAYTLKKPYVGVLVWSWLGYMNPHRLCYGFAYSLPLSHIIALLTLAAYLFSNERKSLPKDKLVVFILLFIVWMGITTLFAFNQEMAGETYIKILKVEIPILLTLAMFNNKERLHQLLWVIIFSIGYFGVKGGIFTVMTGGGARVYGPPESALQENNALAVAELMVIPLMVYMRGYLDKAWQKQIMLFCIIAMAVAAVGSQSRGAFLAIAAVGGYFWLQSDRKIPVALALAVVVGLLAAVLPESWYQRMDTINTYDKDDSAQGRIRAWTLAYNVANHNVFGGGFMLWTHSTYLQYLDSFREGMTAFVAHSIYFHVLGEHGWIGLSLFLLIFYLGWRYCSQIVARCKGDSERQWISDLAKMLRLSLLAYLSGGAFLSLSYLDLPWHLVSIIILLKEMTRPPANKLRNSAGRLEPERQQA
jgi:probable O-glycosylation ligase (exosortase A-associated)